jgi:hypothetical protein
MSIYGIHLLIFLISTLHLNFLLNPINIPKIPIFFFFFLRKKNCNDLGVDQNLTEFLKILMLESFKKKL